ncbi:DUF3068 domain-containing protein [Nocardia nova]|nr:DUF3068 domain-containing protein [Nocardia nova]MDN2495570.1 DUF3068 domain-containing protein [Nocardia nova]
MAIRRSSKILIALGILLIAAAAVVRFAIVPSVSKLPTSLDVTNHYEGTGTLLNPQALQSGDTAHALASNVPVTIDRHTYVSETHGNTAIVHDDFTVRAPGGIAMPSNHTYAVDRKTMDTAPASNGVDVQPHRGLTIGWPISPDRDTQYQLYDFATRTTAPMKYTGEAKIAGRDVLDYTVAATGPLEDKAILSALPPALPKSQLAGLAPLLPAELQAKIGAAAATLPDPVPLNYTSTSNLGLAADKTLGTPADGSIQMKIVVNADLAGQNTPIMPVLTVDTKLTPASISAAADTASRTSGLLNLISLWIPLLLLVLGVVLALIGFLRRKAPVATTPIAPTPTPSSTSSTKPAAG